MSDVLKLLEKKLQKEHKGIVIRRGSDPIFKLDRIETGLIGLDLIIGGGLPVGRLIQFQGPDASGKTTAAMYVIQHNQKINPNFNAMWVASESFDEQWARKVGVDPDRVSIFYPKNGEEGLSVTLTAIEENTIDFLVIDSTAALLPEAEYDGDMDDAQVGLQARMFAKFCRKLGATFNKATNNDKPSKMAVVAINQVRDQIGVFQKFGTPEPVAGGGRALKHTKALDLYFRLGKLIKDKETGPVLGRTIKTKVMKSKVSPPFGTAEFRLFIRNDPSTGLDEGQIDTASDTRIYGVEYGVIDLKGAWFEVDGMKFNGKDAITEYLRDNPDAQDKIKKQIKEVVYGVKEDAEPVGGEIQLSEAG